VRRRSRTSASGCNIESAVPQRVDLILQRLWAMLTGDWAMGLFDDVSRDPDRDLAARDEVMN
jgi:hypothetical protein